MWGAEEHDWLGVVLGTVAAPGRVPFCEDCALVAFMMRSRGKL